jgi:hypothetical protein
MVIVSMEKQESRLSRVGSAEKAQAFQFNGVGLLTVLAVKR